MERRIIALLGLLCVYSLAFAQSSVSIKGSVIDSDNKKPLSNVVCRVYNANDSLLSYSITNNKGLFSIRANRYSNTVSFSLLGYKTKRISINHIGTDVTVELIPQTYNLKEITVHVPPIQKRNDTLVYNVGAFADKQDRYIGDVLKKMPGITVSDDGGISYQGKSISKFYIEGEDLLGNRYNQATKNLPANAVSQVQLMENDQPIKVLKNKKFTDRASLNIRLKSGYKMKPFGEIAGGIGGNPAIWDNRMFITDVGGHNQILINGKMNNAGEDLSDEIKEHIDFSDLYSYEPLPDEMLNMTAVGSTVPIAVNRYLRNKSVSLGINDLYKLSKNTNIRANFLLYRDKESPSDSTFYSYGGSSPVDIWENRRLKNDSYSLVPNIRYECNSDKVYLLNDLKAVFSRNKQSSSIVNNGDSVSQHINVRPQYFQNNLQMSANSGNNTYSFQSFTRYYDDMENMHDAGNSWGTVSSRLSKQTFLTKNRVSTFVPFLGQNLDLGANVEYYQNRYDNKTVSGRDKTNAFVLGFSPEYTIKYCSSGHITVQSPVSLKRVSLFMSSGKVNRNYINYSPSVYFSYDISNSVKFNIFSSYTPDELSGNYLSSVPIYTDYRTLLYSLNGIDKTKSFNVMSTLSYHDLVSMLFCSLTGNLSYRKSNYYNNYSYTDSLSVVSPVWKDTHSRYFSLNGTVDKTFTSVGISDKFTVDYVRNHFILSQFGTLYPYTSNVLTGTMDADFRKLSWLKLVYSVTANLSWQNDVKTAVSSLWSMHNAVKIFVFPDAKTNLSLSLNHNYIQVEKHQYDKTLFADFEGRYALSKRFDLSLKISNIFDTRKYLSSSTNGVNFQSYYLPLRGRELLFSCLFRL